MAYSSRQDTAYSSWQGTASSSWQGTASSSWQGTASSPQQYTSDWRRSCWDRIPFVSADPRIGKGLEYWCHHKERYNTIWCTDEEQAEWEWHHPKPPGCFDKHRKINWNPKDNHPPDRTRCGHVGIHPVTHQHVRMCKEFPQCEYGCTATFTWCHHFRRTSRCKHGNECKYAHAA